MTRQRPRRTGAAILSVLAVLLIAAAGSAATSSIVIRSGSVPEQDEQTWVQGNAEARPGIQNSGLPLGHPYVLPTPKYWGDIGGGAFWICPTADGVAPPGGYEYYTEFTVPDDAVGTALDLSWRADDTAAVAVNNTRLPGNGSQEPGAFPATLHTDITALVQKGNNRLRFIVENGQTTRNPTGVQFLATITYARQPATGPVRLDVVTLKSGHIDRDPQVWVHGVPNVQPGWPSSDLPLENAFVTNTPGFWGDLGGAAFWLTPSSDITGPGGGYEYYVDFSLPDTVRSVTLDLMWRGNDFAIPALNGARLQGLGEFRPDHPPSTLHANITPQTHPGANRLSFFVWNATPVFSATGVVFLATVSYNY